jgi:hypothetical protein
MSWDTDADLGKLTAALEARDKAATSAFCSELIARIYKTEEFYPLNPAKKLLSMLRKRRFFEHMERLADAFIQTGAGSNTIHRLYVQALLDQEHFTVALLVLERLIADTEGVDLAENAEAKGLMSRAYKQLYVNATAPAVKRNQKWLEEAATRPQRPGRTALPDRPGPSRSRRQVARVRGRPPPSVAEYHSRCKITYSSTGISG